jgi:hypothetical protein
MSPAWGSTPRQTDRLTVGSNSFTHSLTQYQVVRPSWALKPGLTDRLVVGLKVTLTLTLNFSSGLLVEFIIE